MNRDKIPSCREAAILAILLNGERYGREIRNEYEKRTNTKMSLGTLYVILSRMEGSLVTSEMRKEAMDIRRDNRRKYFRITGGGREAMAKFEQYVVGAMKERVQWIPIGQMAQ